MKHVSVGLLAVCAVLVAGHAAQAAIVTSGVPWPSGSWNQRFQEDGNYGSAHYNIDMIAVKITGGGPFETPALLDFSTAGWSTWEQPLVDPSSGVSMAVAKTKTPAGYFQWTFHFYGAPPVEFDYVAFMEGATGDALGFRTHIEYDGAGNWSYGSGENLFITHDQLAALPEPASLAIWSVLGLAAAGYGVMRRRPQGLGGTRATAPCRWAKKNREAILAIVRGNRCE